MRKRIPAGIEFYKEMMDKDYYYVDKTLLIKEIPVMPGGEVLTTAR